MGLCQVFRSDSGKINKVTAPNGQESKLYQDILKVQQDPELALKTWAQVYTPSFKEWFGDWESVSTSRLQISSVSIDKEVGPDGSIITFKTKEGKNAGFLSYDNTTGQLSVIQGTELREEFRGQGLGKEVNIYKNKV